MKLKSGLYIASTILLMLACKKNETTPSDSGSSNTNTCSDPSLIFSTEFNGNVIDNSCSGHVIVNNGAAFTTDRNSISNKALSFDGLSYLNYPNSSSLHPSLPFTISFWVNVNDSSDWAHNYFIQSNARPNGGYCGYLVRSSGTGAISLTIGDTITSTTIDATSSVILRSNTWIHYTAVVKANNDVELYFDGVRDNSASVSGAGTTVTYPAASSSSQLGIIGGVHFSTNTGKLKGKLDKIKIWNKALSLADIQSEYNNSN